MEDVTILELQEQMSSGTSSARAITRMYLERIEQLDRQGPAVNAVIEVNPDALAIADSLDEERKERGARGPLHGVPILLKDNIDTADRMTTTAGSLALSGSVPLRDSFVAQRLRESGAVILGKTNLSEWAGFRGRRDTSGWSSRGGQTRNPYALDRSPCGSSSGSAAAVSASLCAAAIGTETDGSIVFPAAATSAVGIKPTVGLVSRSGIIPISHTQDTAGPLARTVSDAAVLLGALTESDPRDPVTEERPGNCPTDYTVFLDPDGMQGARIGVTRNIFGFDERVDRLMESCIGKMRDLGAELIDPANISMTRRRTRKVTDMLARVMRHEFKTGLNRYLAELGSEAPVHSLKEVIEFNEENRDSAMPYFGQETLVRSERQRAVTDEACAAAQEEKHRLSRTEGIDAVLLKHQLDAIVCPTLGPPCVIDLVNGDRFQGGFSTLPAEAGYPHITLPAGYVYGLPVGISFFAGAYQEPALIKLGFAFEQATRYRQPPKFLARADLPAQHEGPLRR